MHEFTPADGTVYGQSPSYRHIKTAVRHDRGANHWGMAFRRLLPAVHGDQVVQVVAAWRFAVLSELLARSSTDLHQLLGIELAET
jgi:hypothetical protein